MGSRPMNSVEPAVYHDVFENIRSWPPERVGT